MLTVAELAEARVERDRATTSDNRKRRPSTVAPPKTKSISITLVLVKLSWRGGCNIEVQPPFQQAHKSVSASASTWRPRGLEREKSCRCIVATAEINRRQEPLLV